MKTKIYSLCLVQIQCIVIRNGKTSHMPQNSVVTSASTVYLTDDTNENCQLALFKL